MAHNFTSPFWHEPICEADARLHDGLFQVGDVPDPDVLFDAGWWIAIDGRTVIPPGNSIPEDVEQWLPERIVQARAAIAEMVASGRPYTIYVEGQNVVGYQDDPERPGSNYTLHMEGKTVVEAEGHGYPDPSEAEPDPSTA